MIITKMPGVSYQGKIASLSDDEINIQERLHNHVLTLSQTIGERHVDAYENLVKAANYIREKFKDIGYEPQKQTYTAEGKAFNAYPKSTCELTLSRIISSNQRDTCALPNKTSHPNSLFFSALGACIHAKPVTSQVLFG